MYSFLLGPIYMTFVFSGFVYAPASHSAVFFNGFLPFLTLLISFIWLKEKISKLQLISVFLILLGAFLILLDGSKLNIGNSWFGDFLFLKNCFIFLTFIESKSNVKMYKQKFLEYFLKLSQQKYF